MADSTDVVAGTNATATEYNNLRKDLVLGQHVGGAQTFAATTTIDWSDKTKGKIRTITLTGDTTIAFSNAVVNQSICIRIVQDGSGNHTPTWPTIKWPDNVVPPATLTANKTDMYVILCTATNTYEGGVAYQNV